MKKSNWKNTKGQKKTFNLHVKRPITILKKSSMIESIEVFCRNIYQDEYHGVHNDEYHKALELVCKIYDTISTDWFAISEACNVAYDWKRIKLGLEPISETLSKPNFFQKTISKTLSKPNFSQKAVSFSPVQYDLDSSDELSQDDSSELDGFDQNDLDAMFEPFYEANPINDVYLPNPIALVIEWSTVYKGKESWWSNLVCVMHTKWQFSHAIKKFCGKKIDSNCAFSGPKPEYFGLDQELFDQMSEKKSGDQKHVTRQYGRIHPVWAFVKLPNDIPKNAVHLDNIQVPFERVNKRAVNSIDVNLLETDNNIESNIRVMSGNFQVGYIPMLVTDFANGILPKQINAIVFNRTILSSSNGRHYKGYRLRVLTNDSSPQYMKYCTDYIRHDFLQNHANAICQVSKRSIFMRNFI